MTSHTTWSMTSYSKSYLTSVCILPTAMNKNKVWKCADLTLSFIRVGLIYFLYLRGVYFKCHVSKTSTRKWRRRRRRERLQLDCCHIGKASQVSKVQIQVQRINQRWTKNKQKEVQNYGSCQGKYFSDVIQCNLHKELPIQFK